MPGSADMFMTQDLPGGKDDIAFRIDKASEQREAQETRKERTRLCLPYAWLDDPGP